MYCCLCLENFVQLFLNSWEFGDLVQTWLLFSLSYYKCWCRHKYIFPSFIFLCEALLLAKYLCNFIIDLLTLITLANKNSLSSSQLATGSTFRYSALHVSRQDSLHQEMFEMVCKPHHRMALTDSQGDK